jgi:hypothetical protein
MPSGRRIQALAFKVTFAPAGAIMSSSFTRSGALAGTPIYEHTVHPANGASLGYVASFPESPNALPFASNAAAPGTLIGHLVLTTSGSLNTGDVVTIAFDPATAILSNQVADVTETFANSGLSLQNGMITIAAGTCPVREAALTLDGTASVCTGGTGGTATVSVSPTDNAASYAWGWRSVSGGSITPIAGATNAAYTIAGADFGGTGTKYLVSTVTPSCGAPVVSNEIAVEITTAPSVSITASSAVFVNAPGNYASVPSQGPGATYAWTVGNGTITAGQGTPKVQYTAGASGNVTIGVTVTKNGCSGPANPQVVVPIISRAAGASMLYLLNPCRVTDTREPGGGAVLGAESRVFDVAGRCGIPAGAKSVVFNLTVVGPTQAGFVALYPADQPWPGTSTYNTRTGKTRANNAIVPLSTGGQIRVLNQGNPVHIILDVTGYFQ